MIFSNLNKVKILSFLSCAIIPLLVTGPFLPDLFLSLLSLWFLYYIFKNKLFYIFKNKFFYLFLAFCLFCIFSSLMSDNIRLSLESSLFYFRIGIFCLLVSYLIEKDKNVLNHFYYTLIFTFSILVLYAFIQYFFKLHVHPARISSFFGDELILGSYLSRLLPLVIALFIIRPNKNDLEKYLFLIFVIFTYICVILSGERSAFFYVNMSLLFILIFVRINLKFLVSLVVIFVTTFTIFFFTLDSNQTGKRLLARYTKSVAETMNLNYYFNKDKNTENKAKNIIAGRDGVIIFSNIHETLYRTAFNMFLDRPIIGHGPKMFRVKCNDPKYSVIIGYSETGSCMTHPHNFYIQLLAETGIIGFSFLFFLFIYITFCSTKFLYYNFFKKNKIYLNYNICLLACLLITVWPIIPNGNFFNNYLMIIYSLPLGFFKKN